MVLSIIFLTFTSGALDQQKEIYEQKLEELRRERTPDTSSGRTSSGYNSEDRILNSTPTSFYDRWVDKSCFYFCFSEISYKINFKCKLNPYLGLYILYKISPI